MFGPARERFVENLRRSRPELPIYFGVALAFGLAMNALGHLLCIAHFARWWQVLTCYWGYVLPVAIAIRHRGGWDQFAWGVVSMVPLELLGYGLGTSIPCPGNAIDLALGPLNFSLAMVAIGGPIPWLLNRLVSFWAARSARFRPARFRSEHGR